MPSNPKKFNMYAACKTACDANSFCSQYTLYHIGFTAKPCAFTNCYKEHISIDLLPFFTQWVMRRTQWCHNLLFGCTNPFCTYAHTEKQLKDACARTGASVENADNKFAAFKAQVESEMDELDDAIPAAIDADKEEAENDFLDTLQRMEDLYLEEVLLENNEDNALELNELEAALADQAESDRFMVLSEFMVRVAASC